MEIVFGLLCVILAFVAGIMYHKYLQLKNRIVRIRDLKPKTNTSLAKAMRLSNELEGFIQENETDIFLDVLSKE